MSAAFQNVPPGTAGEAYPLSEQIRSMRGEPETVRSGGQTMAEYGHLMSEVGTQLRTIKDSKIDQWKITGEAADKLRSSIGDAAEMIEIASALYLPIGQAINRYGSLTVHYQELLNAQAVSCQELWEKVTELRDEYRGSTAPVEADEDFATKSQEREQLESDINDADIEWRNASVRWANDFISWREGYERAVESLSDPALESIRKGEDLSGARRLTLFPGGEPRVRDVAQDGAGDCYLLAVLAGMACLDPQRIKDMITANPDGTYTVHFADGDITVGGDQIPDNGQAGWVRIIEGAYELHEGGFKEFNGGWPSDVMEDIYGKGADRKDHDAEFWDFLNGGNDVANSYDDIERALGDGRPVAVDAQNGQLGFDGGGHALSVLDVYEEDGVKMVVIRNPWGRNGEHVDDIRNAGGELHNDDDGYFTMTMEDFAKSFTYVEIANG